MNACKATYSPPYWKGSIEDVLNTVNVVKKGKVHVLRASAGQRPIHLIEYGCSNLKKPQATLSSALGARDYAFYADKTGDDYCPTVFLTGCIHGGEFEGTAAILNLIHWLETGTDYAGNTHEELLSLIEKVHLLLIPMSNPDGRSHIPFDSFVGRTFQDLRYYNQGTWKDGSLCGWPQCKKYMPIKEHVDYLGGYYNDDGVNMMHDDFFGHACTETQNILDVCRMYAPDVSVLFHGCAECKNHITTSAYVSGMAKQKQKDLISRTIQAYEAVGLELIDNREYQESYAKEQDQIPAAFNLVSAMHHCCGEMCMVFESNQGLSDWNHSDMSQEDIYRSHWVFIQCVIEMAVEEEERHNG